MAENFGGKNLKKSPYVIILGNSDAGKSTLMASICHYIQGQEDFLFHFDLTDKEGTHLVKENMYALKKGDFPSKESKRGTFEVNIVFDTIPESKKQQYTFVEIYGRIVSNWSLIANDRNILEYFNKADVFMLVVDALQAASDDVTISMLFEIILRQNRMAPIILVISKWDKLSPAEKDVNDFVKLKMPGTYKWLKYGNLPDTKIFKFSVGKLSDSLESDKGQPNILELSTKDSQEIFKVIYNYLSLPDEGGKKRNILQKKLKINLSRLRKNPEFLELWEEVKNIYLELGEEEDARGAEREVNRLKEKKEFDLHRGKQVTLQHLELQRLDFFNHLKWPLHPHLNVLLGKSGSVKSHLLRLMVSLLQNNDEKSAAFFEISNTEPLAQLKLERDGNEGTISRSKALFEQSLGKIPLLAIPDMRFIDKSRTIIGIPENEKEENLSHQWASHFLYQRPVGWLIENFLYHLCITYRERGNTFDLPVFQLLQTAVVEILDPQFAFHKIESIDDAQFRIDILTEGIPNPMPIGQISQGTLSVLIIFGMIYHFLETVFPDVPEEDLPKQTAIVFIDEIDAHIHPSGQQKIIGQLRETFPNVQFIMTAYSALTVAGCSEGEVAELSKAKNSFFVKVFEQDFTRFETNELYEKVLEIEKKGVKPPALKPLFEETFP